jgi:hypothetical protein
MGNYEENFEMAGMRGSIKTATPPPTRRQATQGADCHFAANAPESTTQPRPSLPYRETPGGTQAGTSDTSRLRLASLPGKSPRNETGRKSTGNQFIGPAGANFSALQCTNINIQLPYTGAA